MNGEIKILCVDDEPNVLNALKRLFLDEPYTILTAASGQEGLEIIEKEDVQIIISDYRMPGMNGVDFLKEARKKWPDTVRIVLSGYADTAAIVSAINEGQIYKFVPKPWNDDELKVTISNAVERYYLFLKNMELTEELRRKNNELTKLNKELKSHLAFRARALAIQQNILDAMPVGIVGIDFNNLVVLCNSTWIDITNTRWQLLGQSIESAGWPECIKDFVGEVKDRHKAAKKIEINGIYGRLSGAIMDYGDDQKGIILVFSQENDVL
ncbi:MAG: response regulator [Nitrospirota bacterium]